MRNLPLQDIVAILRGADELIGQGGRTILAKLLKGSREKAVLAHDLHRCPSYGYYSELTIEEILHRVDWVLKQEYLSIRYEGQLPVLIFSPKGWDIEKETMAEELLEGFDARLAKGPPFDMSYLKDRNRGMIMLLLDKIEESGRRELEPLLLAWAEIDYQKVRARIASVLKTLSTQRAT